MTRSIFITWASSGIGEALAGAEGRQVSTQVQSFARVTG